MGGGGMFERILLAVDGSQPSNRAAEAAAELACRLGSAVRVLQCPVLVIR
jgi:nucleotide-binding universal stress UspA family protein